MSLKINPEKIAGIFLVVLFFAIPGIAQNNASKPNVILIMTDDQGYGDLSSHGHPTLETPNLDRLYNEGVHFTDFHVSPYCAPTRASLLTGRYTNRTGVWHTMGGRNWMFEDETTMAEIFKANGYVTGHFGKWHLGDNYPFAPHFRGFDTSFMLGNSGLGATDDYWGNDRFNDTYFLNGKPVKTKGYGTDVFVERALNFVENNKHQPFFVYLATNIPHRPWNVPSEYRLKYDTTQSDTREVVPYGHTDMARYYGLIDKIDEQTGKVLEYLDKNNLTENTIILFMTDNGTVSTTYNAGMRGRKTSPYEGGHRVPLFIKWPAGKLNSGKEINQLTTHMDILPTLMDLCNLHTNKNIAFDGQSFKPLLFDDNSNWDEERIYITQSTQQVPGGYHVNLPKWKNTTVCFQKWRLVKKNELYNINKDPGQKNNVALQNPEILKKLQYAYERYWNNIYPDTKKIARVHLGNPNHPLTTLSLVSVTPPQGGEAEWSMNAAVREAKVKGKWPVFIEQEGLYEIELRRWPREIDRSINSYKGIGSSVPMRESRSNAVQINPVKARIVIRAHHEIKKIDSNKHAITFQLRLSKGPTNLQTSFIDKDGTSRIVYWNYIRKIK